MGKGRPPLWKVKRELRRFPVSVSSKARAALGPVHRIRHDLTAHRTVTITPGDRPATPEPAVLLIYQPDRLLESLFLTLEHLVDQGLSVVLVANHPLDATKMAALKPWCHKLIERPNIGYDFGGYRQGVLHVLREMPDAERLFLLNDSNWFPAMGDSDLIPCARAAPEDVYGVFQTALPRKPRSRHMHSYFYRFGRDVLRNRRFRRFWRKMRLLDDKRQVVRYQEFGFSRALLDAGFTMGSYHSPADLLEAAMQAQDETLREAVALLLRNDYVTGEGIAELATPGAFDLADRDAVRRTLEGSSFAVTYTGAHPGLVLGALHGPILKKNREPLFRDMRQVLRASPEEALLHPAVRRELADWDD